MHCTTIGEISDLSRKWGEDKAWLYVRFRSALIQIKEEGPNSYLLEDCEQTVKAIFEQPNCPDA